MPNVVIDPTKQVTDPNLLAHLAAQGIDWREVEFFQDYAIPAAGETEKSPNAKFYRDLNSNKRFMVVSSLPMVDADGVKIEAGWRIAGINYFSEKNNLFRAKVQGLDVELVVRNDQPDGRKANNKLSYKPQLFLDGVEQSCGKSTLLPVDPVNSNYQANTLEWDYGICKRRLRIIEGSILGSWVFATKPSGTVKIKYNQTGDYKLRLGQFAISDGEEQITPEQFNELAKLQGGYPVTISDTATFYPESAVVSVPVLQFTSGTVNAYPLLIRTGPDTILLFYNESNKEPISLVTDWLRIVKRTYTISTTTWSAPSVVWDRAPNVVACPAGGIIGNNIFIFCGTADWVAGAWKNIDWGYIKSTDLTGDTWGAYVVLGTYGGGDTSIEIMSHLVHVSGNTYVQAWHHISGATYRVKIYKTTDAGANWNEITVYSGATTWNEPAVTCIGNNKLIILMHKDGAGGYLGQATSADSGDTWSAVSNTNLGLVAGIKIPDLIYDSETDEVIAIFEDRGDNKEKASLQNAGIIYASPTSWLASIVLDASNTQGYPSIVKVGTKNFFYVYEKLVSATRWDIWGGYLATTTSFDGVVGKRLTYGGAGESWANLISALTSNYTQDSGVEGGITIDENDPGHPNTWCDFDRVVLLFDTSPLPGSATISAATLSLYGAYKGDSAVAITPNINIYSSNPASNIVPAYGDFNSFGSIPLCLTPITYVGWNLAGYNDFVLNAAGIAAIIKGGITKLAARNANYDVAATPPTWTASGSHYVHTWFADKGVGFKPKLVVTYTLPPTGSSGSIAAKMVGAGAI